ncbi:MAG TPA: hypothetical protein VL945_00595 [Candidatus Saccharimonadales bacterium]|nr:hypothetical protein [Candidatus Saccharimonadales bacterium]
MLLNPRRAAATTDAFMNCHKVFGEVYGRFESLKSEDPRRREPAHGTRHMYSVAMAAIEMLNKDSGFWQLAPSARDITTNLAGIAAIAHDMVRNPSETGKTGGSDKEMSDGYLSADVLRLLRFHGCNAINGYMMISNAEAKMRIEGFGSVLKEFYEVGIAGKRLYGLTFLDDAEFRAITNAIEANEFPLDEVSRRLKELKRQENMVEFYTLLGLTWGDKGAQGIGPSIIWRRAEFVARDRHDKGDLRECVSRARGEGFAGNTRVLVFALESLRRIYALKFEGDYPEELSGPIREMRGIELDIYFAAAKSLGFRNERELLEYGLRIEYPGLRGEEEKIRSRLNFGLSTERIAAATGEQGEAVIMHYAAGEDLPALSGKEAQSWMERIAEDGKADKAEQFRDYMRGLERVVRL